MVHTITIIGAGNVATHLAIALSKVSSIQQIASHQPSEALYSLAKKVGAQPVIEVSAINLRVDCILVCVPDDNIDAVFHQLKHFKGILAHTSGSKGIVDTHIRSGFFYPLQTFKAQVPINMYEVPLFIGARQASDETLLLALAKQISSKASLISEEEKQHLHLSAVMLNNFVNHLFGLTKSYLQEQEVAIRHLEPIIRTTIERALQEDPLALQTGPAIRNDIKTIHQHVQMLEDFPRLLHLYKEFTKSIQHEHV